MIPGKHIVKIETEDLDVSSHSNSSTMNSPMYTWMQNQSSIYIYIYLYPIPLQDILYWIITIKKKKIMDLDFQQDGYVYLE